MGQYSAINGSNGNAYNDDALNVKRMNVKPGGVQPVMRDTCWNGKPQKIALNDGRPNSM